MGSLQEQTKQARLQEIEVLCKTPHSIKQIAAAIGTSYHTARNDVTDMVKNKRLRHAVGLSEGSMTFVTGETRPMPMFHVEASNSMISLKDIASSAPRAAKQGTTTSTAAVGVATIAADLLHHVALIETGVPIETKHLLEIRKELAGYYGLLNSTAKVAKQMLDSHVLWNVERLAAIALDETWDAAKANAWQDAVIQTAIEKSQTQKPPSANDSNSSDATEG